MAFTVSYSAIPNSDIDPDSPLATGLFQDLRDNTTFCLEYIGGGTGGGYTPAAAHTHDGVNSAIVPQVTGIGYEISSSGFLGVGGGAAITIPSITIGPGQSLLVWGVTYALYASAIQIRHDSTVISSRTPMESVGEMTIFANDDTERTGDLELFLLSSGSSHYNNAQIMYQIIQE